jgi:hypothetical protein
MVFNKRQRKCAPANTDEDFNFVHKAYPVLLNPAALPTKEAGDVQHITMKQHLWTSTIQGSDAITYTETGDPFPMQVIKKMASRHAYKAVLRDNHGQPRAVLLKNIANDSLRFQIYGFELYIPGQWPSSSVKKNNGRHLYLWGTVVGGGLLGNRMKQLTLWMINGTQYKVKRVGRAFIGRQHTLYRYRVLSNRNNQVCADIQQQNDSWNISVGPGIDPCLMIALTAILDEARSSF